MSLAHFTGASAFLIVCLMGAAWAAPTTPSSGSQSNIEPDSQANDGLPEIKATTENQSSESAATTLGAELTSEFPEDVKCRSAWQMFLVSSDVHYASDSESQKRRKIFCANWIQEPNALYELGKVSQWADLTFEEWKNKQRPILAPEFAEVKPTTDSTEEERRKKEEPRPIKELEKQHPAAFPPNLDVPENKTEATEVKSDWPGSYQYWFPPNMEQPGIYDAEPRIKRKLLKEELTEEEPSPPEVLEEQHPATFPPNMDVPENKTEATEVKGDWPGTQQYWYPPNMEEPGTYLPQQPIKPNESTDESSTNLKLLGNETKVEEVDKQDMKSGFEEWMKQQLELDKFPPNMEEPGTYVPEPTTTSKPLEGEEKAELRRIKDKEEPPNMELSGNKTKETEADLERIQCQAAWEKFLSDFGSKYENEAEKEKRRNIFCANWQRIQEHNAQYELGKVTYKKSISEWADLTFEEWKKLQEPSFPPNTEEPGTYLPQPPIKPNELTVESSPNLKLLGNETEVDEVNEQDMKSGFEEWLKLQLELDKFPPNMEEPGTYLAEPRNISKLLKEELTVEEPSPIEDPKEQHPATFPPNMNVPENKTEATEGKGDWPGSQQNWYPPNMEKSGTYIAKPRNISKPNMELSENKTEASKVDLKRIQCQAAWEKFLSDFGSKYENEAEKEKRRIIFCANWKRIQEHNAQYELGKVSHKKSINQWADLTFEEWKNKQRPRITPDFAKVEPTTDSTEVANLKLLGNETEVDEVNEQDMKSGFEEWLKLQLELDKFPPNMEEPGTYLAEPRNISKLLKEELTVEEPSPIEDPKEQHPATFPPNMNVPENKTEATEVKGDWPGSQQNWYPPNMEEPGTYIAKPRNISKPNMELAGNKTEASKVDLKRIQCQAAWEKFLSDFGSKYENEAEKEKRRIIFCANWQRIQEHNAQYELGKVSHKKSINQWADLTFEEWKNKQRPRITPDLAEVKPTTDSTEVANLKLLGNETEVDEVNEQDMKSGFEEWLKQQLELDKFPPNMEEPGTYLAEPRNISKLLKEELTVEEPSPIEDPEEQHPATFPPNMDVSKNKTEATEVKAESPPNMEEPGPYIAEPPTKSLDEELKDEVELSEEEFSDDVKHWIIDPVYDMLPEARTTPPDHIYRYP